jgi:hypothetical protein
MGPSIVELVRLGMLPINLCVDTISVNEFTLRNPSSERMESSLQHLSLPLPEVPLKSHMFSQTELVPDEDPCDVLD